MLRRTFRTAIVLSAALTAPGPPRASADEPLPPKAEEVLDQYVEATGGKAAYEKIKNRVSKGTMEVTGAGLKGDIRETSAAPAKSVQESRTYPRTGQRSPWRHRRHRSVWESHPTITGDRD